MLAIAFCPQLRTACTLAVWVGPIMSRLTLCSKTYWFCHKTSVSVCITVHWLSWVRSSVHNKSKVKFGHSSNQMEHNRIELTHTHKTQPHLTPVYFNWTISVIGYKHVMVWLPSLSWLPGSKLFLLVSNSTFKGYFHQVTNYVFWNILLNQHLRV
jgi:hypothetical protein